MCKTKPIDVLGNIHTIKLILLNNLNLWHFKWLVLCYDVRFRYQFTDKALCTMGVTHCKMYIYEQIFSCKSEIYIYGLLISERVSVVVALPLSFWWLALTPEIFVSGAVLQWQQSYQFVMSRQSSRVAYICHLPLGNRFQSLEL